MVRRSTLEGEAALRQWAAVSCICTHRSRRALEKTPPVAARTAPQQRRDQGFAHDIQGARPLIRGLTGSHATVLALKAVKRGLLASEVAPNFFFKFTRSPAWREAHQHMAVLPIARTQLIRCEVIAETDGDRRVGIGKVKFSASSAEFNTDPASPTLMSEVPPLSDAPLSGFQSLAAVSFEVQNGRSKS